MGFSPSPEHQWSWLAVCSTFDNVLLHLQLQEQYRRINNLFIRIQPRDRLNATESDPHRSVTNERDGSIIKHKKKSYGKTPLPRQHLVHYYNMPCYKHDSDLQQPCACCYTYTLHKHTHTHTHTQAMILTYTSPVHADSVICVCKYIDIDIDIDIQFGGFMRLLSVRTNEFLFLVPFRGLFLLCAFLYNSNRQCLFYLAFYYYPFAACFLMRDRKEVCPDGPEFGEEL